MTEKEETSETVLQVNSFIRGYYEYQEIWMNMNASESHLTRLITL